ncbi:MAG: demethoxyubiquinone hydroxylase family protein [Pseudomonadales bacterium]
MAELALPSIDTGELPRGMLGELRSDHAGETGAVAIYQGMMAVTRDAAVGEFARRHMHAERVHLAAFDALLPRSARSRLLPLWRLSGWLLGAAGALGGRRGAYLTVAAVEAFVVEHYQNQIDALAGYPHLRELRSLLERFQGDEDHHRDDALALYGGGQPGWSGRAWSVIVDAGSRAAVAAARRL